LQEAFAALKSQEWILLFKKCMNLIKTKQQENILY